MTSDADKLIAALETQILLLQELVKQKDAEIERLKSQLPKWEMML